MEYYFCHTHKVDKLAITDDLLRKYREFYSMPNPKEPRKGQKLTKKQKAYLLWLYHNVHPRNLLVNPEMGGNYKTQYIKLSMYRVLILMGYLRKEPARYQGFGGGWLSFSLTDRGAALCKKIS